MDKSSAKEVELINLDDLQLLLRQEKDRNGKVYRAQQSQNKKCEEVFRGQPLAKA